MGLLSPASPALLPTMTLTLSPRVPPLFSRLEFLTPELMYSGNRAPPDHDKETPKYQSKQITFLHISQLEDTHSLYSLSSPACFPLGDPRGSVPRLGSRPGRAKRPV